MSVPTLVVLRPTAYITSACRGVCCIQYRVAQKVSHYRESSLNCIKNRQPG